MDLKQILNKMILAAKEAGAFIKKESETFEFSKAESKGLNDMVSYVDKTAELMIVSRLQEIVYEAGFIVEENTRSGTEKMNWIVDPLDGTTNFIHGIPCYSVSIALEDEGEIVAGVVYEVNRDECFSACRNGGAFLNEKPINVSERKKLSDSLIATGFPVHNFSRSQSFLNCLNYLMQHSHGLRRLGSAATDLCYVACGRVDGFFEYNLNAWDVAAGALIVKEAGGTVEDFKGGNNWLFGKEIAATNTLIHREFTDVIRKHF